MKDNKKAEAKADQAKADETQAKADQRAADRQATDQPEVLSEDQAPANPVESDTLQANYDPTGQIQQPGQPLHSTDPEEQARFEQERQEAIRRSQLGESYVKPGDRENDDERTRRDRKNS
jgi:hypothetical protein